MRGSMDQFLDSPAKGEAPNTKDGFRGQTANGTALAEGNPGWNRQWNFERPQVPATGPWGGGANRTGE